MTSMLTTRELQELINVDRSTIYRMAESGRLPAVKVGRQWRFPEADILGWLGRPRNPIEAAEATTPSAPVELPVVESLLADKAVQAMIDLFADLFGVMVVITDMAGSPLTAVANPCGFYNAIASVPEAREECTTGWAAMASDPGLRPHWDVSPLGFLCAHAFIRSDHRLVGMVMAGGLAADDWPPTPSELAEIAAPLHVPAKLLAAHAGDVYHADAAERARVLDYLQGIGDVLSRFANERSALLSRLGEIATLAAPNKRRSLS